MSIQLSRSDFQKLVQIIQDLPAFATERDRRQFIAGSLEGTPKANMMLAQIDLSGAPMTTAVAIIRFLTAFGQVAYGKEALGVFLNYILPLTGEENATFITNLFDVYPLDAPVSFEKIKSKWGSADDPTNYQEKIIGENTLRHIFFLDLAVEASRSVVHLCVTKSNGKLSYGTGFLITPCLLITNNHVIASSTEAHQTEYSFNYQLGRDGRLLDTVPAQVMPSGLFYTNPDLDYTVTQLADNPGNVFGSLKLRPTIPLKDDRVTIIQHPGGHLKKISIQNNFIVYADRKAVQYTTSTLPGSSGSPVLNEQYEVIAIHHSGGMLVEPGSNQTYLRNEGTSMVAILDDLRKNAQAIFSELENK